MHLQPGVLVKVSVTAVKESEFCWQNNSGEKRCIIFYISGTTEKAKLAGWLTFKYQVAAVWSPTVCDQVSLPDGISR